MRNRMWWFGALAIVVSAAWTVTGKDEKNHNWPAYSGDKASTKYSPLDQINKDSVAKLSIVWRQSGVPAELKAIWTDASAPTNWQNTQNLRKGHSAGSASSALIGCRYNPASQGDCRCETECGGWALLRSSSARRGP